MRTGMDAINLVIGQRRQLDVQYRIHSRTPEIP